MSLLAAQLTTTATPSTNSNSNDASQGLIFLVSTTDHSNVSLPIHYWIIDTGATCHIACCLDFFITLTPISNCFVTLPNGSKIAVHSIGTVKLSPNLILHNVLYIPPFHVNLISVGALLITSNISAFLRDRWCFLQDLNQKRVIGKGEFHKGIYVFKASPFSTPTTVVPLVTNFAQSTFLQCC